MGEPTGQHHAVVGSQVGVFVPDRIGRLAEDFPQYVERLPVAVRTGKNGHRELQSRSNPTPCPTPSAARSVARPTATHAPGEPWGAVSYASLAGRASISARTRSGWLLVIESTPIARRARISSGSEVAQGWTESP